jgi:capsular polysaccharide biosynthesis protein
MNQSEMATNLEKRQQGEHFRVVDAPNLPTKPYSPNRLKLSLMGLFAGLALGAVFTMGAEFTDDRVHSERVLKKMIPVDVIAEIPSLATVDEQSTRRREIWVALISAAVAMFIIAVGLGITYLRG